MRVIHLRPCAHKTLWSCEGVEVDGPQALFVQFYSNNGQFCPKETKAFSKSVSGLSFHYAALLGQPFVLYAWFFRFLGWPACPDESGYMYCMSRDMSVFGKK